MAAKLSQKTKDTYESIHRMIQRNFNTIDPKHFIEHVDDVIVKLDGLKYSLSTKKMMAVVMNKMTKDSDGKAAETAHEKYGIEIMKYNNAINHLLGENMLNEKEEKKYIEYDRIIDLRTRLEKIFEKNQSERAYHDYMLLCTYTMFPPRRVLDYAVMKITDKNPDTLSKEYNYLFIDKKEKTMWFVFNVYKTSDSYGIQKFQVPRDLQAIYYKWIELYGNSEFLLGMDDRYSPNENRLTKYMIRLFEKYTGIPAGVSVIRHSYISHATQKNMTLREREELSKKMAHSIYLQLQYARYT